MRRHSGRLIIFRPCQREQIFCRIRRHFRVQLVDGGKGRYKYLLLRQQIVSIVIFV